MRPVTRPQTRSNRHLVSNNHLRCNTCSNSKILSYIPLTAVLQPRQDRCRYLAVTSTVSYLQLMEVEYLWLARNLIALQSLKRQETKIISSITHLHRNR
jgi:hypothetical protein